MSLGSISGLTSSYLQSLVSTAIQKAGVSSGDTSSLASLAAVSAQQPDNGQLSPFAQLMSTLQQLQQSDPTKYQQVTQQIADNLKTAASTAQSDGNTTAATQLTQLATDFTNASENGQLPNIQDLAQAIGGGHHHHHHHARAASSSDSTGSSSTSSDSSGSSSTATSASDLLKQLLAAFQSNGVQNSALDPMSIIESTLQNAGITATS